MHKRIISKTSSTLSYQGVQRRATAQCLIPVNLPSSEVPAPCRNCPLLLVSSPYEKCALRASCPAYRAFQNRLSSSACIQYNNRMCCYCGSVMHEPFECKICQRVQPLNTKVSYFELLNDGKASFDMDFSKVKKRYLALQRRLHPDQFNSDPNESFKAADWSANINRAYETLRDPLKRAIYLYNFLSTEKYCEEKSGSSLDQDELLEILDLREALENSTSATTTMLLLSDARDTWKQTLHDLGRSFNTLSFKAARHCIDKLKFYETVIEAAEIRHESHNHQDYNKDQIK